MKMKRIIAAAAAAAALAIAGSAIAQEDNLTQCVNAWNDSEAADVCTKTSVVVVTTNSDGELITPFKCKVSGIACTVDETDTEGEVLNSWTLSDEQTNADVVEMRTTDVCFAPNDSVSSGYDATLRHGCSTGELTSDQMQEPR